VHALRIAQRCSGWNNGEECIYPRILRLHYMHAAYVRSRRGGLLWAQRQHPHIQIELPAQVLADAGHVDAFRKITEQRWIDLLRKPEVHAC
jgi:hypothetical protein